MSREVLQRLDALVGEWKVEPSHEGQPLGSAVTTFEWAEDRSFLIQHSPAPDFKDAPPEWAEHSPLPVVSIYGLDDTSETFTMLYADARDVQRVYKMKLADGEWKIWREAPGFFQRFAAAFSDDGNVITGRWEHSPDGEEWNYDFDLTYRKVTKTNRVVPPSW